MLDEITPIIITYNEEPNIGRCLDKLYWAHDIVVVDNYSDDGTIRIAKSFPQVRVLQCEFTTLSDNWNFALQQGMIQTEWVLALDADFVLSDELIREIENLTPNSNIGGFRVGFRYQINNRILRTSLYPPIILLYRKEKSFYEQDGHAYRVYVEGEINELKSRVTHDDRKSMKRWMLSQIHYSRYEADKILNTGFLDLPWPDKIRKLILPAPLLMFFYCFFYKLLILNGAAGFYYSIQRTFSEAILSVTIIYRFIITRTK